MSSAQANPARRWFLVKASAAAAAGLALGGEIAHPLAAAAQSTPPAPAQSGTQLFTAAALHSDIAALEANPGNETIVDGNTFTIALTVETNKAAKEFEWHEGRDHIFQILSGSTMIEVGGTPKNARNVRPGEWLAPESMNAEKISLSPGDMLIIRRGTPHRRTTTGSVTLMLISPQ